MQRMARAEHIGKIVLKVRDDPDQWRSIFKSFQERYGRGVSGRKWRGNVSAFVVEQQPPTLRPGAEAERSTKPAEPSTEWSGGRPPAPIWQSTTRLPGRRKKQELVGIWESALGVAPIGVHDDFFRSRRRFDNSDPNPVCGCRKIQHQPFDHRASRPSYHCRSGKVHPRRRPERG